MKHRNVLHTSFTEYKLRLDPSSSYVIAEKSAAEKSITDLSGLDDLADIFQKHTTSQKLIFDARIQKWILVIKLSKNVDHGFFISAIPHRMLKDLKVYLWSSR